MPVSPSSRHFSQRIVELDGVRGLACLFVLIHHYFTGVLSYKLSGPLYYVNELLAPLFLSGVDLFYVLSGFLVGGIIIDYHRSRNFLRVFFIRRICRIFPVYFALILSFALGLAFLRGHSFFDQWLLERPLPLWSYFTFTQSYVMGFVNASGPKWAGISWSVSVEEQFYLLTPFLFLLFGTRGVLRIIGLGLLVAPLLRLYFFKHYGFYAAYMMFPGRFDTILYGVLLAYVVRHPTLQTRLKNNVPAVIVCAGMLFLIIALHTFGILTFHHVWFYSLIGMFYASMMWLVLERRLLFLNRILLSRFLIFTGFISYGMYMYHQLVNGLIHGFAYGTAPRIDSMERAILTLAATAVVYLLAYASYRYFETPIRRYGARFKYNAPVGTDQKLA